MRKLFAEALSEVTDPTDLQLQMYGIGRIGSVVVAHQYGSQLSDQEVLHAGMPYILALRSALKHEPNLFAGQSITIAHDAIMALPPLAEATWRDRAREELVVDVACAMQELWRQLSVSCLRQKGYCKQYQHLPLYFLDVTTVEHYLRLSQELFDLMRVQTELEMVKTALRQRAAEEFYRTSLDGAATMEDALKMLSCTQAEATGFGDFERTYFYSRSYREKVAQQLQEHHCVSLTAIRRCADLFGRTMDTDPRSQLDALLKSLLPY